MRAGKISRELVFESWRVLEEAAAVPFAANPRYSSPVHPVH